MNYSQHQPSASSLQEEELIYQLIRVDEKAFRHLVEKHQQRICNTRLGFLRKRYFGEMETMVSVVESLMPRHSWMQPLPSSFPWCRKCVLSIKSKN